MRIHFEIEAGVFIRNKIKQDLENSKAKIQHWYPSANVLLIEDKDWFESKFFFEAKNLPDSAENHMRQWLTQIRNYDKQRNS